MKRFILYYLTLTLIIGTLSGCGKNPVPSKDPVTGKNPTAPPSNVTVTAAEFEAQLRMDAYPESSVLMSAVGQAVRFSDFLITEDTVTFTITAPHIAQELIAWYDSIDTISDEALVKKVIALLAADPVSTEITLNYTFQNARLNITYSDEYLKLAGCGIQEYYNYVYTEALKEMGVANDG